MDRASNPSLMERVLSCPATEAKLAKVRAMLEGRRIRTLEFVNEVQTVGIRLHLDNRTKVVVTMAELSLTMLLRDPEIGRQEQDLFYRKYSYRPIGRRKRKKGAKKNEEEG